jgi:hypothetical protein
MPKFVIEREMAGAGQLTPQQLQAASRKSAEVMQEMGRIHWVQSYVTGDKIYCVYAAPNEAAVREHARLSGLPATRISEIRSIADATTGE